MQPHDYPMIMPHFRLIFYNAYRNSTVNLHFFINKKSKSKFDTDFEKYLMARNNMERNRLFATIETYNEPTNAHGVTEYVNTFGSPRSRSE